MDCVVNRFLEILICLMLGVVAVPMFAVGCAIVLTSVGRPLMFSQRRSGRNGQDFQLFKLRSMKETRDADGVLLPDADRQTRATALLRRLRIDELPQLILVLRNKMALVGPRPLLPETIAGFGTAGQYRCSVRPGLTGWAQVSGNTNLSDTEKLCLDLWYVAHRSLALDLRIMAETLGVAIRGERRDTARIDAATSWVRDSGAHSFDLQEIPA